MKFQTGGGQKFVKAKTSFSYDRTEPINDDVICHILRLRDKLGWQTLVPPCGFVAKPTNFEDIQMLTFPKLPVHRDDGEYIYCLIRSREDPKAPNNPYDLQVVSANVARKSKEYWTVTASFVSKFTSVHETEEIEITPIIEWLYERQLYYALCRFSIYINFRKKKYFNQWKTNVKRSKMLKSKIVMYEQLFFADEAFQSCLLYIQGLCNDAVSTKTSTSLEVKAIQLIKIDTNHTYTLDEFCEKQYQQSKQALNQLQEFKEKVIKAICSTFLKVAEAKGAGRLFQHSHDDAREKPKYFEIAEWRHVMDKFSRFLQLVDRIFQELLRKLVHIALDFLLEIFQGSNMMATSKEKKNEDLLRLYKKMIERALSSSHVDRKHQWLFQIYSVEAAQGPLCHSKKPETHYEIITIKDIDKLLEDARRQMKREEDYPPLFEINLCLRVPFEKDNFRKSQENNPDSFVAQDYHVPETLSESLNRTLECDEENAIMQKLCTSSHQKTSDTLGPESSAASYSEELRYSDCSSAFSTDLYLVPNRKEFSLQLQGIMDGLENIIDQVEPFCQNSELSNFVCQSSHKVMYPYEDHINSEQQQYLTSWPNCDLILGTDPDYHKKILTLLSIQSSSLAHVERYSKNFMNYCEMVDKAKNSADKITALKRELSTHDFRNMLQNYTTDTTEIVCMIIERRIRMFKVNSFNFQADCLPYFEALLNIIHSCFYTVIEAKNVHLVEVIQSAISKLSKELTTVDGFIEHLLYLHEIVSQLPKIKEDCNNLSVLYFISKDYDIFLPLQQLALYQTAIRSLQHLQSVVIVCEKRKDEYVIKFNEGLGEYIDNLQAEIREFKNKVRNPVLLLSETLVKTAKEMIQSLIEEDEVICGKIVNYTRYQAVLDSSIADMKSSSLEKLSQRSQTGDTQRVNAELSEIESELGLRQLLWNSQEEWTKLFFRWKNTIFWNLDVDVIQKEVNRLIQIILILEKGLPENTIVPALKNSLLDFKEFLPVIISLRNPCLQPRHWEIIQSIVEESVCWDKKITLDKILELNMLQYRREINEVSARATSEVTLEVMLKKIIGLWYKTDFHLSPYHSETSTTTIISSAEDILALLEDSQVTISTIKGSSFVGPIKSLVDAWDRKLKLFSSTLVEWLTCQRNWIYLEPIFHAAEMKRQLPAEANIFSQVDNKWREIMKRTEENPNALRATTTVGVFETMQTNNAHLEKIQKSLEGYLEVKRMIFPRFYFLSNAELLEILAERKTPDAVQPHLVKCFANIKKLCIRIQEHRPPGVVMIKSAEGEMLVVPKAVRIRGPAEQWLGNVESTMCDMIKRFIAIGITEWSQMEFKEWFFTHPGQVILLVSQIMFTKECERIFQSSDPKKEMIASRDEVIYILDQFTEIASEALQFYKQTTLEALVILYIHCRDILTTMIERNVFKSEDFEWKRQLHYEWHELSPCRVTQGYASFDYGYEYLGCSSRLVITPLTDRCWLTLTGALQLNLGGCPVGPAGTGKTETVKDLSKALGKLCLVFNCSEGLDDKVMGKFFCGLVQSGAWCCFDEFNRIDVEVLSAIASQIQAIKAAKDSHIIRFVLEGKEMRLKPFCGIFITMNPGYKGRVELPDNLKSLFRPVSMMVPDYKLIAEIMLFSEGFKSAKSVSGKIVNLYQLCSKQLSQQDHYDFGMRAIKAALIRSGQKMQELKTQNSNTRFSEVEETLLIISVLKEANLPKLLVEDVSLFEDILTDLFPGMNAPKVNPLQLEKAIFIAVQQLRLQPWPSQIEKVMQFYNQILARVGVMLVGPTGGGKTTIRKILERALIILPLLDLESFTTLDIVLQNSSKRGKVDTFVVNPKCVSLGELFGQTDPNTMEWSDGLLASAVRTFAKLSAKKPKKKDHSGNEKSGIHNLYTLTTVILRDIVLAEDVLQSTEHSSFHSESNIDWQWIVLDGPVDPMWIENLNSALDDSRTLCLANSERIYLSSGIRMIFEVDSLSQASPATVSRCAMVYVDPVELGWEPYVKTWLKRISSVISENDIEYLESLFQLSMKRGLEFLDKNKKMQIFSVHQMGIAMNLCRILGSFINIIKASEGLQCSRKEKHGSVTSSFMSQISSSHFFEITAFSGIESSNKNGEHSWFWQKQPSKLFVLLGKLFIFAFTWAFGGILKREDEHEGETLIGINTTHDDLANLTRDFNFLVRDIFESQPPANIQFPAGDRTAFDYFVDLQTGEFVTWGELVPSTQYLIQQETADLSDSSNTDTKMDENQEIKRAPLAFIPNIDTIRYTFLTSLLLLNKHPVLIIGDSGSGRTAMIQNMLGRLQNQGGLRITLGTILGEVFFHSESKKASFMKTFGNFRGDQIYSPRRTPRTSLKDIDSDVNSPKGIPDPDNPYPEHTKDAVVTTIQFSAHTSAAQTHALILQKLVTKSKDILGAPRSKQVLVFIDDLNVPIPEEYGAQPPLELIRQFLDLGGFYDTHQLVWKHVQDMSLVASCTASGEGRKQISTRLLTHFCMLALPATSLQSLQRIFQVRLGIYFYNNRFSIEVQKCTDLLTCSSIALYYKMSCTMLPTPTKCHYTFNLQDLFKVLRGLLQAHRSVIASKESTALLLVHESARVFHDRLIEPTEREIFYQFISNEIHNYFKILWSKEKLMENSPIFVDFLDSNTPVENRIYKHVTNHKRLLLVLEEHYNKMQKIYSENTSIVFFKEVIHHVTRTARIFRQEGGHMTMIGLDGSGKSTCASLACYLSSCSLFKLSIFRNYSHINFRDDLKKVYKQAGLEGTRTVLLINDSDIIQESFLEDLSCILNSGQVPELFQKEELDNIIVTLAPIAEKANYSNSIEDIYSLFLKRVHTNLHLVLIASSAGQTFRQHCRVYPAIVNYCTVDWYENWPEEAFCYVAKNYFTHDYMLDTKKFTNLLVPVCVNIHQNVSNIIENYLKETKRHYYITPNSYLQFIKTFATIFQSTKEKTLSERVCYHSGLTKILEATSQITEMQDELLVLGPQIKKKSEEIEELVEKLHRDSLVVEQVRILVKQDEELMAAETLIVEEYAKHVTEELNAVMPSLEKAHAALDALDKNHIAEIRVYTHPPPLVLTVMNAVCVLLQKKPTWATAKLLLADPGFLKRLTTLDKDNLPEKVLLQLKKYVKSPDFSPTKVGLVSVACCSICQWILALDNYRIVKRFVDPKQAKVTEAEDALKRAHEKLAEKQKGLVLIEQHQQDLEERYKQNIAEQEILATRKDQTTRRLKSASVLSTALKDEMERWKELVNSMDQRLQGIIGDALISAACIVYSGVLTAEYRQQLVNVCLKLCNESNIPVSSNYSLVNCMTEKIEVRQWQNEGLPLDQYSTENVIHIIHGQRWPLLIDPEKQAYKWIRQMAKGCLRQIRATDSTYFRTLENSMRMGESVLLEDITEKLESNMKLILRKDIYRKGGQAFIRIGESEVEYNENFRLYMTTQKANPHFLPAICKLVTIINFTVTFQGLQDQLLSAVVIHEKPELEQQRCALLENISADLVTLRELEQKSLRLLQKTDGHILDDQDLINNLQRTKITSTEISERVQASARTEDMIEKMRKKYLPIATRGAVLYFTVSDLVHINHMYQFSLVWFHKIFVDSMDYISKQKTSISLSESDTPITGTVRALSRQRKRSALEEWEGCEMDSFNSHVNKILDKLTSNIYKTVSSALFSEHQLCFSFLLCATIMKNNCGENQFSNNLGFIPENQWNFFLYSNMMANIKDPQVSENNGFYGVLESPPLWITELMWKECQYMSTHMPSFNLLCNSLLSDWPQWEAFLNSQNVYHLLSSSYDPISTAKKELQFGVPKGSFYQDCASLHFPWENLSSFERLILIKVLRPKCLNNALREFVSEKLGSKYLSAGGSNLKEMYEESDSTTPLILIHTQGRGQETKAEELIYKAQILTGQWAFLQNCHLAPSFMPRLCTAVDLFNQENANINPQFRLWLSSTPVPSFPESILRKAIKIVIESPQGLKGKLLQTFGISGTGEVTEVIFNKSTCGPSWKRLLFSLCFFNAVIHERKKYGTLGWNIPYEFSFSDLQVSIQMLEILLDKQEDVPWAALHYLTGEVVYGGRITDDWDRRCLLSILNCFCDPSLLKENFAYTRDCVYRPISEADTLKDCRAYLQTLPESDSAELFGMHPCAEQAFLKSQAQMFIDAVASTQPKSLTAAFITSGGKTQDEIVLDIASDILTQLPLTVEDIRLATKTENATTLGSFMSGPIWAALVNTSKGLGSYISTPLITVLRQEIDQFNRLLTLIIQSLHALQQGTKGKIMFTTDLEQLYNSLLKSKVPDIWQQNSYVSCKPLGSWTDDLILRLNFFAMWANQVITCMQARHNYLVTFQRQIRTLLQPDPDSFGDSNQGHPSHFWLPGFFFPQGFLTAVLQNHARLNKISVDSLTFVHKVLPFTQNKEQDLRSAKKKEYILNKAFQESSATKSGVMIFGLYIDGACWSPTKEALEEPDLHARYYPLPDMHFLPQQIVSHPSSCNLDEETVFLLYECPLYRTPHRSGILSTTGISSNFVTSVYLPTLLTPSHWITRGVALLCQLDD
ncbi:dynein axonemal heavy chain 14 isoform X2 [Paroedura picta]|uniref:dynein axonemal heavy chain 14 isoform X2 n=1 Tax=Paroedura picta TaxID=143630 RepID=UPI0040565CE6